MMGVHGAGGPAPCSLSDGTNNAHADRAAMSDRTVAATAWDRHAAVTAAAALGGGSSSAPAEFQNRFDSLVKVTELQEAFQQEQGAKLASLYATIDTLKRQLLDRNDRLERQAARIGSLDGKVAMVEAAKDAYQHALDGKTTKLLQLQEKLAKREAELSIVAKENRQMKRDVDRLTRANTSLEAQLEGANAAAAAAAMMAGGSGGAAPSLPACTPATATAANGGAAVVMSGRAKRRGEDAQALEEGGAGPSLKRHASAMSDHEVYDATAGSNAAAAAALAAGVKDEAGGLGGRRALRSAAVGPSAARGGEPASEGSTRDTRPGGGGRREAPSKPHRRGAFQEAPSTPSGGTQADNAAAAAPRRSGRGAPPAAIPKAPESAAETAPSTAAQARGKGKQQKQQVAASCAPEPPLARTTRHGTATATAAAGKPGSGGGQSKAVAKPAAAAAAAVRGGTKQGHSGGGNKGGGGGGKPAAVPAAKAAKPPPPQQQQQRAKAASTSSGSSEGEDQEDEVWWDLSEIAPGNIVVIRCSRPDPYALRLPKVKQLVWICSVTKISGCLLYGRWYHNTQCDINRKLVLGPEHKTPVRIKGPQDVVHVYLPDAHFTLSTQEITELEEEYERSLDLEV